MCVNPLLMESRDYQPVPCGKCLVCRKRYIAGWQFRLMEEEKRCDSSLFLTLTYDTKHIPITRTGRLSLSKRDVQLFFKRLRKRNPAGIKYFACGEYGGKTKRPHYHVIIFGDVPDEVIRKCWQLGQVHIGNVTQASIMYCLGYLVNAKGWQMAHHRERPFSLMSRRPGLGHSYLTPEMIEWHNARCAVHLKNYTVIDGVKRHLPRYYKLKLFSKINLVRIAVRDQKEYFKKQVEWLRSPSISAMRDPSAYKRLQMQILAKKIRAHSKSTNSI